MSQITDAIDAARREWTGEDARPLEELRAAAAEAPAPRSLAELLSADQLALIVEPKRATAERGTINEALDLASTGAECEAAGAMAMSIVTEPHLSGGSHEDLRAARGGCGLLLLARDFVVDARQVLALRAAGADALLLPARLHVNREPSAEDLHGEDRDRTDTLAAIVETAHRVGMEVVLSVQTDDELAFAIETDADALNIDNRGGDGRVDVERTFELLADVPVGWPVISESIAAVDQVAKLHRAGVDALLLDEGHLETGLTNALAVYADLTLDA